MTSRSIPVGANPSAMATDSERGRIYVANSNSGTVSVIDTTTETKEPKVFVLE